MGRLVRVPVMVASALLAVFCLAVGVAVVATVATMDDATVAVAVFAGVDDPPDGEPGIEVYPGTNGCSAFFKREYDPDLGKGYCYNWSGDWRVRIRCVKASDPLETYVTKWGPWEHDAPGPLPGFYSVAFCGDNFREGLSWAMFVRP